MEKRYNTNATTDWFTPSNWTPAGVPTVDDTVIRESNAAPCVLANDTAVCGEFIDHSVSMDFNGKVFTVGNNGQGRYYQLAQYTKTAHTGTVRIHGHDVYVNGSADATAQISYEFFAPCRVKQFGTRSFRKINIKDGGSLRYEPGTLEYAPGNTVYARLYSGGLGVTIDAGGELDVTFAGFNQQFVTGQPGFVNHGRIVNHGTSLHALSLNDLSVAQLGKAEGNIAITAHLRANNIHVGGTLHTASSVVLTTESTYRGIIFDPNTTLPDCTINNGSIVNNGESAIQGDVTCYGNLEIQDGYVLQNGFQITAAGTGDQTLIVSRMAPDANPLHIELAKRAGTLAIHASSAVCMAGRQPGLLKLSGAADYTACGDLELSAEPDTSELTGTFTQGEGMVIYRYVYASHFYVARLYVQSNTIEGGVDTLELKVIQDARQL